MLGLIIVLLIVLWILGFIQLPVVLPNPTLFVLNGNPIDLFDLIIFGLIIWAIGILPSPFREIAVFIFILWVLSMLGILAITGLSNILLIGLILGLIVALFSGSF